MLGKMRLTWSSGWCVEHVVRHVQPMHMQCAQKYNSCASHKIKFITYANMHNLQRHIFFVQPLHSNMYTSVERLSLPAFWRRRDIGSYFFILLLMPLFHKWNLQLPIDTKHCTCFCCLPYFIYNIIYIIFLSLQYVFFFCCIIIYIRVLLQQLSSATSRHSVTLTPKRKCAFGEKLWNNLLSFCHCYCCWLAIWISVRYKS